MRLDLVAVAMKDAREPLECRNRYYRSDEGERDYEETNNNASD